MPLPAGVREVGITPANCRQAAMQWNGPPPSVENSQKHGCASLFGTRSFILWVSDASASAGTHDIGAIVESCRQAGIQQSRLSTTVRDT